MMTRTKLWPVPYLIGDGSGPIVLYVLRIAEFPRDGDHQCAFCHGDPCAERSGPETEIAKYYARAAAATWRMSQPDTCPLCSGRPS